MLMILHDYDLVWIFMRCYDEAFVPKTILVVEFNPLRSTNYYVDYILKDN